MKYSVSSAALKEILPMRAIYLQENNFYNRYHACHERGWSDAYIICKGETITGYGAVKGKDRLNDRDAIFEFYIFPQYRRDAGLAFVSLIEKTGAGYVVCQSNDLFLANMLYRFTSEIFADVFLFSDQHVTEFPKPGLLFRLRKDDDNIFPHQLEPPGDYVLEKDGEVIATGGFMLHYNFPFADIYMEVKEEYRMQGYGSYLVQELKKTCYSAGRVPGARCNTDNLASRGCLLKAGFKETGFMLTGTIKENLADFV